MQIRPDVLSKLFDTLSWKRFLKKFILKKDRQTAEIMKKFPSMHRVQINYRHKDCFTLCGSNEYSAGSKINGPEDKMPNMQEKFTFSSAIQQGSL